MSGASLITDVDDRALNLALDDVTGLISNGSQAKRGQRVNRFDLHTAQHVAGEGVRHGLWADHKGTATRLQRSAQSLTPGEPTFTLHPANTIRTHCRVRNSWAMSYGMCCNRNQDAFKILLVAA